MPVPPNSNLAADWPWAHPHIGLQTFTWMIQGEALHRDSLGNVQVIRPGQVNLMTAGHGIAHTESLPDERHAHAAQLWIALPYEQRDIARPSTIIPTCRAGRSRGHLHPAGRCAGRATGAVPALLAAARCRPGLPRRLDPATDARPALRVRPAAAGRRVGSGRRAFRGERTGLPGRRPRRPATATRPWRAGAVAGWRTVRCGDLHVVELRRPQQGRDRPGAEGLGGGMPASAGSTPWKGRA